VFNFNFKNKNEISSIKQIFRDNFEIWKVNDLVLNLVDSGLITLSKNSYIKCVNRGDRDFLDLTEDQKSCTGISHINEYQEVSECQNCDRQLISENKEKFEIYIISINYNAVINELREKLGKEKTLLKNDNTHIIYVDGSGKKYTLCILDLCKNVDCKTSIYYSDEILYIYCDVVVGFDAPNVIWLFDLLIKRPGELLNFIKMISPMISSKRVKKVMENFIDGMTWQEFEDFIPQMLNYIRDNPKNYNEGMSFLQKYSGTIISAFSVKLSGSGKTDAYSINLLNYFKQILKPDIRIECKHSASDNINSSIGINDLRELMDHSYQKEGVIFTNRKKIDGSAINRCIDFKEEYGQWKYVIIHRPLLKLLISLFFKELWDKPELSISSLKEPAE